MNLHGCWYGCQVIIWLKKKNINKLGNALLTKVEKDLAIEGLVHYFVNFGYRKFVK
jgi:hypothetical protein